jgi:dihydrodipicolinate synthase/N-acetylneuraminate lyase
MGAKATTSELACPMPDHLISIYCSFAAGDLPRANEAQTLSKRITAALPKSPSQDNFLKGAEGKYILSLRGISESSMSGYYREVTEEEKTQIARAVEEFKLLENIAA